MKVICHGCSKLMDSDKVFESVIYDGSWSINYCEECYKKTYEKDLNTSDITN